MNPLLQTIFALFLAVVLGNNPVYASSIPLSSFEEGVNCFEQEKHKEAYEKFLPLANKHDLLAQEYLRDLIIKDKIKLNKKDKKKIKFPVSAPLFPEAKEWVEASLLKMQVKKGGNVEKEIKKLEDLNCCYAAQIIGDYYYEKYLSIIKDNKKSNDFLELSKLYLEGSKLYYESSREKGGYRAALQLYTLRKTFEYNSSDFEKIVNYCILLKNLIVVKDEGERYEKIFEDNKDTDIVLLGSMHGNPRLSQNMLYKYAKDNPNFLPCLEAQGHSGNLEILKDLGVIYYKQFNNFPKAYTWLMLGGERGIKNCYGFLYLFSDETNNYEAHRIACEKLVETGHPNFLSKLGYLYMLGLVGTSQEENDKKAVFYLKKSMEMNKKQDSYMNLLTMMREKRGGLKGDEEEQLSLLQHWVEFGENPKEALYLLGQHYHSTNPELAEKYYTQASEKGHAQSFANLFEFEVNKTANVEEKKEVFNKIRLLAEKDHSPEMQFLYGTLLYRGVTDIAESNPTLALEYVTLAAKTLKSAQTFLKQREQFKKWQEIFRKLQASGVEGIYVENESIELHSSFFKNTDNIPEKEETDEVKLYRDEIKEIREEYKKSEQELIKNRQELLNKKSEDFIPLEEKKEEPLTNNEEVLREEEDKKEYLTEESEDWEKYINFDQYKNKNLKENEVQFTEHKKEKEIDKELKEFMNTEQVKPIHLNQILNLMSRFTGIYGGEIKRTSSGFLLKKDDKVTSFHKSHGRNKDLDKGAVKSVLNLMNEIKNEKEML